MSTRNWTITAGASALMMLTIASPSRGQDRATARAPYIHIYSTNGGIASNYVEPAIDVSENAYVFAVSMDLDGHIQVLHPDFPGISVKIAARRELQLPKFFAGFSQPGGGAYGAYGYAGYSPVDMQIDDMRGVIIALASREPFNLDLIESGGDWNISQIRSLIQNRNPQLAASNLAHYLGARGQPIGRDYMRFAGGSKGYYGYADAYASCDYYNGYGYASSTSMARLQAFSNFLFLRQRGVPVNIIGYDYCGIPVLAYGSRITTFPGFPTPRAHGDTTVFPKTRFPRSSGLPRNPSDANGRSAAMGIFPLSRRSGTAELGDVTVRGSAVAGRRDPREILNELGARSGSVSFPRDRIPTANGSPTVREPARIGTEALHEYRPAPSAGAAAAGSFPEARTRAGAAGESSSRPERIYREPSAPREGPPRASPPPVASQPASSPPPSSPPPRHETTSPPPRR